MGGGLKAQIFNGKYMAKLEFLVGWVGLKPESCGGEGGMGNSGTKYSAHFRLHHCKRYPKLLVFTLYGYK